MLSTVIGWTCLSRTQVGRVQALRLDLLTMLAITGVVSPKSETLNLHP